MKKITLLIFALLLSSFAWSQHSISGTIKDANNEPLPGANIIEKGTSNGATSDFDGKFSLMVQHNAILVISFSGFDTQEIAVGGKSNFTIVLKEGLELDEVIVTGSRTPARSNTSSALPVDIVSADDLIATGQTSFDKALQYKIPSFNTVQTPVNDATSLLDPYEIRNMGPSRTLILINGKRKNLSALLYAQDSPGRGETGADISAIPTDAIKSIQILRDGASAQYGSDAIAGVMNVILKDDYKNGSATFRTGVTGEGDGEMLGVSINNGTSIGDDNQGFINYTIDMSKIALANRPGKVSAEGEAWGGTGFGAPLADVQEFLSRHPDAGNINGSPETAAAKFLVNGAYDLSENTEVYFNAAYVHKNVNSFANYRTPYWKLVSDMPYLADLFPADVPGGFDGYVPTFEGILDDYNATVGFKSKKNGWNTDASITFGGNKQTYIVNNSHNSSDIPTDPVWADANGDGAIDAGELSYGSKYRENSPTRFNPGGTAFNHVVGNMDVSKVMSDHISIAFGTEFRTESFEIVAGDAASYEGSGPDSFAGNDPKNSGVFQRYNLGGYFDVAWDINDDFLINATARAENYSDFGSTFVWKASSRYKFADDKYTLRASVSTGFRAPTLHQIYTEKSQYSFAESGGIEIVGLISNVSPRAREFGIPKLGPEESTNFTMGLGGKPTNNFSFTFDYYKIDVDNRIVYSQQIEGNQFFINGFKTTTSGIDVVTSLKRLNVGAGKLALNLSGNYTISNERVGDMPTLRGEDILGRSHEALMFTSRPKTKWILGANYEIGKVDFSFNNTYFGKTTFKQKYMSSDLRTEFTPKIVTDLGINYNATDKITIALNVNNLLNILPEWNFVAENAAGQSLIDDTTITGSGLTAIQNESNAITFNNRYAITTYDGSHFSQLGRMFNLSLNYRF